MKWASTTFLNQDRLQEFDPARIRRTPMQDEQFEFSLPEELTEQTAFEFIGISYNFLLRGMELINPVLRDAKPRIICPEAVDMVHNSALGLLFTVDSLGVHPPSSYAQAFLGSRRLFEPPLLEISDYLLRSVKLPNTEIFSILDQMKPCEDRLSPGIEMVRNVEYCFGYSRKHQIETESGFVLKPGQLILEPGSRKFPLSFEFGLIPPIDQEKKTSYAILSPEQYYDHLILKPQGLAMIPVNEHVSHQEPGLGSFYEKVGGLYLPEGFSRGQSIFEFFPMQFEQTTSSAQTITESDKALIGAFFGDSPFRQSKFN